MSNIWKGGSVEEFIEDVLTRYAVAKAVIDRGKVVYDDVVTAVGHAMWKVMLLPDENRIMKTIELIRDALAWRGCVEELEDMFAVKETPGCYYAFEKAKEFVEMVEDFVPKVTVLPKAFKLMKEFLE